MSRTPDSADPPPSRLPAVELPTLLLALFCYAAWLALTSRYGQWPAWIVVPGVAVLLTLHSSLQHEILHGHPTRSLRFNALLGSPALSLWIPYQRFRATHLAHHVNARLTDPLEDPESNYWTVQELDALPAPLRALVAIDATLAGRVLVGSWLRIARFLRAEAGAIARDDPGIRAVWLAHLAWCAPVVAWVTLVCGIPLWLYLLAMVVPGNGILLIRSYAEHRAKTVVPERTAIVEDSRILGPLFLYNNLHALHHEEPALPWYRYNARYRELRERLLAENRGLVYAGYADLARRYLFRAHDVLEHPLGRVPECLDQAGKG
jgi:fatty acid desaturase